MSKPGSETPLGTLVMAGDGQQLADRITDTIFMVKDISNAYLVTTGDGDLLINTGFVGNGVIPFGDPASTARPYAIGGVGVYRLKFSGEFGSIDISDTQTKFGINIGGGFQFNLSGFDTFVEARFHSVFTEVDNTNFIPLSFGFKF